VRKKGGRLTVSKKTFIPHEKLYLVFFYVVNPEQETFDAYVIPSQVVHSKFSHQKQKGSEIYRLNTNSKKRMKELEGYKWDLNSIPRVWKTGMRIGMTLEWLIG
jgi:hypothetical protein